MLAQGTIETMASGGTFSGLQITADGTVYVHHSGLTLLPQISRIKGHVEALTHFNDGWILGTFEERVVDDVQTPTLVFHGEQDYRVVAAHGLTWYNMLKQRGVSARMVYYPDENHWILKPRNIRPWYGECLGWLERWL
ncbi:MAG TPA: prolyl oligopeptidase family serine peptidase [Candidatus Xenobia bacterium]|jgi:pimeloyl-ACP methyl ester carboxylesterase